jgi:hypothetical protein
MRISIFMAGIGISLCGWAFAFFLFSLETMYINPSLGSMAYWLKVLDQFAHTPELAALFAICVAAGNLGLVLAGCSFFGRWPSSIGE